MLIAARFVQGLAGGVGIVIAQAAGRDIYTGGALIRFYGRLTVVGGFAAIVGPLLGGVLNTVTDWRGLFVFLAAIGAVILVVTLLVFGETLPLERRTVGGFAARLRDFRTLLSDRVFLGAVLNQGFLYAALFAYLSGATFVLQDIYGLSPQGYAAAFGLNSAGFMAFGYLAGRAAERWSIRGTLTVGICVAGFGAVGLLASGLTAMPLWVVIVSLFLLASGVAISSPPATTLALVEYPQIAGTASSLLGMVRFGFGGIAAPLVGVAGAPASFPSASSPWSLSSSPARATCSLLPDPTAVTVDSADVPTTSTPKESTPCVESSCTPPATSGSKTASPSIIEPTDAIIRVTASCICGSDLWPYRGAEPVDHQPMGHEYVGVVTEIGADVKNVKVGDFVVGSFFASDNTCEICQAGYQSRCVHANHRADRHPGRVRPHPARRRHPGRHPGSARRRPDPVAARRIRRARHRMVRRRRRRSRPRQDRRGRR